MGATAETQNGVSGFAEQNTKERLCGETAPGACCGISRNREVRVGTERMTLCHVDGDNVSFVLGSLKGHCWR
jgi:hypothetical protein